MSKKLKLNILTPEKEFFNGEVDEVLIGSIAGPFGILSKHVNTITPLVPFITEYIIDGKKTRAFTSSGMLRVQDSEVVILCDACEDSKDIDIKRAEESKSRAEKRLNQKDGVDIERAKASLARAMQRIKLSEIQ